MESSFATLLLLLFQSMLNQLCHRNQFKLALLIQLIAILQLQKRNMKLKDLDRSNLHLLKNIIQTTTFLSIDAFVTLELSAID